MSLLARVLAATGLASPYDVGDDFPLTLDQQGRLRTIGATDASGNSQGTVYNPTVTQQAQSASFAGFQVSVPTTATLIAAANSNSRMLSNTGTVTVVIGPTAGVTATTGYPLPVGAQVPVTWTGAIYGIVASGTGTIGVLGAA